MSTPRHRTRPGASYFVTTKCWQGRTIFQVPANAQLLIGSLFHYRQQNAYLLHEFVLMPDHLHLTVTPGSATSLEKVIQLIKGGSSHQIRKQRDHKLQIWQEGFHDWMIRDADDWRAKTAYIAMNPVRALLVQNFRDWPYCSASGRFVIDPMPAQFSKLSSGAEAQTTASQAPGLKPRPPKEIRLEADKHS